MTVVVGLIPIGLSGYVFDTVLVNPVNQGISISLLTEWGIYPQTG